MADGSDIDADSLFDRVYVDKARLRGAIRRALQRSDEVALYEIVAANPLEQGLAELVAYLSIATEEDGALIDDAVKETICWTDAEGLTREATMPRVIFARSRPRADVVSTG